jgi:putative transcriptional regulator
VRGFNVSSAYSGHPVPVTGRRAPGDGTLAGKAHVVKKTVLNRLRELRQEHELTQEQLAADLEVTRHTILALEVGRYVPSIELALRLAAYFDRPLETIFWLDPEEDRAIRGLAPAPKSEATRHESEGRNDG